MSSSTETEADIRKELAEIRKLLETSDESKRAETVRRYNEFRKKHPKVFPPGEEGDIPTPDPEPECPPLPEDGRPQPSKGASQDPSKWKVVVMNDDPSLFKIIDDKNINVADLFKTKANADQYIAHFKCTEPPVPTPGPNPEPIPTPIGGIGPYPTTGKELQSTTRGPTTRHYASGKPDDETIEKNVKKIPFKNYQFIMYTTMHKIDHDDAISVKFGGTHNGSGWFDCGVSFEEGQCCLGTEKKHPSTQLCVVKGPKIGNILEKKIGIAGVYKVLANGDAHIELWTDFPAQSGWKKQLEGNNVNNFNPKSDEDEAQERIDGFSKNSVPTLHLAIVQEIA